MITGSVFRPWTGEPPTRPYDEALATVWPRKPSCGSSRDEAAFLPSCRSLTVADLFFGRVVSQQLETLSFDPTRRSDQLVRCWRADRTAVHLLPFEVENPKVHS